MSRDGSGVYTLPPGYLAIAGATIQPSQHNPPLEDVAAALTESIARTGVTSITANIPWGGFKITGLGDATADTDALNRQAADARYASINSTLPRGYLAGLTLSNNATDATNDIDIAVGTCRNSTNANDITLASAITKRLDGSWAVGTNQGGLDTGSIANTTYHVYLIRRSDTGVVDAIFSTSASGPSMPANYDSYRRIGSIIRASGAILLFTQRGGDFWLKSSITELTAVASVGTSWATLTLVAVPTGVPMTAKMATRVSRSGGSVVVLFLRETGGGGGGFRANANTTTGGVNGSGTVAEIITNSSAQIDYSADAASTNVILETIGWVDARGRDS